MSLKRWPNVIARIADARHLFAGLLVTFLIGGLVSVEAQTPAAAASSSDGSGGKTVAHRAGAEPVRVPEGKLPAARLLRTGEDSSEPTLGVTKNGDIFFSSFKTNTRVDVLRSRDSGKTWEIVSPQIAGRNVQLVSLDPYVWVDPYTDRVFTIDLTLACSYMSFSDDHGETWTTNPLACGRPVNDHQTLFSGPPATSPPLLHDSVIYYCWNDIASSACSKSITGGLTFAPTGTPAFLGVETDGGQGVPAFCGGLHGHGHVGPDGTVYLPKGHCGFPWLAISKDEGLTWSQVKVAKVPMVDHEASVAADAKGNVYYTFVGRDRLPYLVVSRDGGETWGKAMMIGPPGLREANLPSLAIGGPGGAAVTYMGSENSPHKPRTQECTATSSCPTPDEYKDTTWNGYFTVTRNALAKEPLFYSGTVNDKSDPLVRGACGPGRCQAVYDFIDVTVDRSGTVWGAFVDGCTLICGTSQGVTSSGREGVLGRLVGLSLK